MRGLLLCACVFGVAYGGGGGGVEYTRLLLNSAMYAGDRLCDAETRLHCLEVSPFDCTLTS